MGFIIMINITKDTTRLQAENFDFLNELLDDAIEDLSDTLNEDDTSSVIARALSVKYRLANETKKLLEFTEMDFKE